MTNTQVFSKDIDDLLYQNGFHYSYAAGPGKDYRSIEKYEGLKYPIIFRHCFADEREVGEAGAAILLTNLGKVNWKIPYDKITDFFIKKILEVAKL